MKRALLFILLFSTVVSWSQDFFPPITHYAQKDYGKNESPTIYSITQDANGVMYFGAVGNILSFNGQDWDTISVQTGKVIRKLHTTSSGTIYVGTTNDFGVLKSDKLGKLKFFSLRSFINTEIEFKEIWNIHSAEGKIYFQSEEGIFIYNEENQDITTIRPEHSFHTAYLSGNHYYVRQRKIGLQLLENNKELTTLTGSAIFKEYAMFGIYPNGDQEIVLTYEVGPWVIMNNKVSAMYLPKISLSEKSINEQLNGLGLIGSIQLQNGNILVKSQTTGATEINQKGEIVRNLSQFNGLKTNVVNEMFQSSDGTIWLATTKGISKVNYADPLSYFGEKSGLSSNVKDVVNYYGTLYAATEEGLLVKSAYESKFHPSELPVMKISDLVVHNDIMFLATSAGLIQYDPFMGNYQVLSEWFSDAICIDTVNNKLISAGSRGVEVNQLQPFKRVETYEQNLGTVLGIELSDAPANCDYEYWIGTNNGALRLSYMDGFGFTKEYGVDAGITQGICSPFYINGQLAFGSSEGLLRFVNEYEMAKSMKIAVEEADGYFDFFPFKNGVVAESQPVFAGATLNDKIWLGGADEILEITNQTLSENDKRFFTNRIGGIINNLTIENDVLYIATTEGLYTYKTSFQSDSPEQHQTLFRSIIINQKDTILNGTSLKHLFSELSYKNNDIEFTVSAPYFGANNNIWYRFKLIGKSDEWSAWSKERKIGFTNLHEGNYELVVESKTESELLGQSTSYRFTILPPWYRTWWAYTLFVVLAILVIFVAVKISAIRLKQKNKELEGIVAERTKEIAEQRDEILHQKTEIEDSINYAVRIQEAMLPFQEDIYKSFPEHFVLFKPKDVVSGDFYWHYNKGSHHILVCADCTGHGVPGAFMSMVGSDKLSHAVTEYGLTMPNDLLSFVNQGIKKALKQDETSGNSTRDGMDVAIITYDSSTNKLYYSGANRSLMILENEEVSEIKATKVAVGGFTTMDQEYELHEIDVIPSQTFYMSTDGYADQFGGEKGKKLKVKAMKNIIIENGNNSMEEQKQALDKEIMDWMTGYEQVDDICVIGVRFK